MADHRSIYRNFLDELESHSDQPGLATSFWIGKCREMKSDARVGSQFDFLRWPSLEAFSAPESWMPAEYYEELSQHPDWATRWFPLTRDSKVGAPKDFSRDFGTSPILIQHAYHLMRYERSTNKSLNDCDVIFEIGGGYGSFCRLLKASGFSGLHIIYDLPHVSSIQRLYLGLSGLTEVDYKDLARCDSHKFCLTTDETLGKVYDFFLNKNIKVGFVATWSLSETPMALRDKIFPRFHQFCSRYLIAFQPHWETIDNVAYFDAMKLWRPELRWNKEDMPRAIVPPSFYLFS